MSREFAVLKALFMDVLFAVVAVLLYWLSGFPTYALFFAHAGTWLSAVLYYYSTDDGFWLSSLSIMVGLLVSAVDVFVLLNTLCYVDGVQCCVPGVSASPFTLGYQACGLTSRVSWQPTVWLAATAVLVSVVVTGVVRAYNAYSTRSSASLELGLAALYVLLKAYVLSWPGVTYGAFFYVQSVLTATGNVAALFVGYYLVGWQLKLLLAVAFLFIILLDVLTLVGSAGTIVVDTGSTGAARASAGNSWTTATGGGVPSAIVYVWIAVHAAAIAITFFEMLGLLVRNSGTSTDRLAGPFDRFILKPAPADSAVSTDLPTTMLPSEEAPADGAEKQMAMAGAFGSRARRRFNL